MPDRHHKSGLTGTAIRPCLVQFRPGCPIGRQTQTSAGHCLPAPAAAFDLRNRSHHSKRRRRHNCWRYKRFAMSGHTVAAPAPSVQSWRARRAVHPSRKSHLYRSINHPHDRGSRHFRKWEAENTVIPLADDSALAFAVFTNVSLRKTLMAPETRSG